METIIMKFKATSENNGFVPLIQDADFSPLSREASSEKYTVFRSPDDGQVYCMRNIMPRFTVKYVPDDLLNNIEFINF